MSNLVIPIASLVGYADVSAAGAFNEVRGFGPIINHPGLGVYQLQLNQQVAGISKAIAMATLADAGNGAINARITVGPPSLVNVDTFVAGVAADARFTVLVWRLED